MTGPNDFTSVACPLPDCAEPLHLIRKSTIPVYPSDLANPEAPASWNEYWTATWHIECEGGHVILTPGPVGCGCEEDPCPHDTGAADSGQFDWSEEMRRFRASDLIRLRTLVERLTEVKA